MAVAIGAPASTRWAGADLVAQPLTYDARLAPPGIVQNTRLRVAIVLRF